MAQSLSGKRVVALDGIRGVAIVMVMALHFICSMSTSMDAVSRVAAKLTSYGVWGVDLFFVLSGYLITGILYDAKGRHGYFRSFYMRRTLRIFPLYYGVLAVLLFLVPDSFARSYAPELLELKGVQIWLWSYLTNFHLAQTGEFSIPYVSHFWSLAVEEQFYLVWPFVIASLTRKTALVASVLLSVTALACRIGLGIGVEPPPLSVVVLTPCRLDALCVGAAFALVVRGPLGMSGTFALSRRALVLSAVGILAASLWHLLTGGSPLAEALRGTLLAVFFGAVIVVAAADECPAWLERLLSARWLVELGKYSYGLYVFHGIVAYALHQVDTLAWLTERIGHPAVALTAHALLASAISLAIAMVSFELFEQPFLRLKRHFTVSKA